MRKPLEKGEISESLNTRPLQGIFPLECSIQMVVKFKSMSDFSLFIFPLNDSSFIFRQLFLKQSFLLA